MNANDSSLPEDLSDNSDLRGPAEDLPTIDPQKAAELFQQLVARQNLPMAIAAGLVASLAGAVAWAAVTIITKYQIGWMAVGVGFLVGVAVRYAGRGLTKPFGFVGGGFSLLGCLIGNFLAVSGLVAQQQGEPVLQTMLAFATNPDAALELMRATFSPMDLFFYAIAVYEGYKFSFREISDQDLNQMMG